LERLVDWHSFLFNQIRFYIFSTIGFLFMDSLSKHS
jgi:hypothetical protein